MKESELKGYLYTYRRAVDACPDPDELPREINSHWYAWSRRTKINDCSVAFRRRWNDLPLASQVLHRAMASWMFRRVGPLLEAVALIPGLVEEIRRLRGLLDESRASRVPLTAACSGLDYDETGPMPPLNPFAGEGGEEWSSDEDTLDVA